MIQVSIFFNPYIFLTLIGLSILGLFLLPFLFLGKENILKKALLFSISLFLTLAVGE